MLITMKQLLVLILISFLFTACDSHHPGLHFRYNEIDAEDVLPMAYRDNNFTADKLSGPLNCRYRNGQMETQACISYADNYGLTSDYSFRNDSIFIHVKKGEKRADVCDCTRRYRLQYKLNGLPEGHEYPVFLVIR